MIRYVQSVYIMSDKINYANCMKRKYEQCRYYDYCFRYRPKRKYYKNIKNKRAFDKIRQTNKSKCANI